MADKNVELFSMNTMELDVEELEERVELAALYTMNASPQNLCGADVCAANLGTPCGANACAAHWCPCAANYAC